MKVLPQRIILDTDNRLFKRAHPVLLSLFCRGVQETNSKQLLLGAGLTIVLSPMGWLIAAFRRGVHIIIILTVWWFVRGEIAGLGVPENLVLAIALVAVLYKEIYRQLLDLFLHSLIVVTGGGFLRWMCAGYTSGTGFRQLALTGEPMARVVGIMVNTISPKCRDRYEEIMSLYLDSNNPENERRLEALLDTYSLGAHGDGC